MFLFSFPVRLIKLLNFLKNALNKVSTRLHFCKCMQKVNIEVLYIYIQREKKQHIIVKSIHSTLCSESKKRMYNNILKMNLYYITHPCESIS